MTAGSTSNTDSGGGSRSGQTEFVDIRAWCLTCYDRREAWVLRSLGSLGVGFRHAVLEGPDVCHSCRTPLPAGTHATVVTIPVRRATRAASSEEAK